MKPRKDGRYCKKVTLSDGTQKYFYSNAKNEKTATADFNKQILEYEKEIISKNSFKSVAEKWAEESFDKLELNTLRQYKPGLRDCIAYFENKYIQDITPTDVKNFVAMFEKKGFARKTIKGRLLVLNLIMKSALIEQLIIINPCQFIKISIDKQREKRQAIKQTEIEIIKNNADLEYGFFALFLLYTGVRRGEALALTPKDIDFNKNTIRVSKTVEFVGNKPQIKNHPKTNAGFRTIPLPDFLMPELIKRKNNNYIFQNSEGNLEGNTQCSRKWDRYIKASGICATPHQLRHTYATMLFDADIDVKTAQTWLGHTDIKTTLDIYTHLSQQRQDNSIAKWNNYLK